MKKEIVHLLKQEADWTLRRKRLLSALVKLNEGETKSKEDIDTQLTKTLTMLECKHKIVQLGDKIRYVDKKERAVEDAPSSSKKRKETVQSSGTCSTSNGDSSNSTNDKHKKLRTDTLATADDDDDEEKDAIDRLQAAHGSNSNSSSSSSSSSSSTSSSSSSSSSSDSSSSSQHQQQYPPAPPKTGNNSILLFYAYCSPLMSAAAQDKAIAHCHHILTQNGVTGRLRVGREGFNGTLTGPHDGVRVFTAALRTYDKATFGETDFKYVDHQPDNQLLKGLKVFPVREIVTYGFDPRDAPLDMRGTHLTPKDFHTALAEPNSVVIDVRNFNETAIGRFAPPGPDRLDDGTTKYLDPMMRRSTEFPVWLDQNKHLLEGKKVLMYCTAGVRCERASAFMRNKGVENVFQLEGGIHRYLDAFPEDGGYWIGKNYVFDKRFSHGAAHPAVDTISTCVYCQKPWDRYQAQKTCAKCSMEVILCKDCQKGKPAPPKEKLICPLCSGACGVAKVGCGNKRAKEGKEKAVYG